MSNDLREERILGIRFLVGAAPDVVNHSCLKPRALVVAPAAAALVDAQKDNYFHGCLVAADFAILDSGFLVLLCNIIAFKSFIKLSGLAYLRELLKRTDFINGQGTLWILPSEVAEKRCRNWHANIGLQAGRHAYYVAPIYVAGEIKDEFLLSQLAEFSPRHIVIGLGGGTQERLGFFIRENLSNNVVIHCLGAAVAFLSGDQAGIPVIIDRLYLGWLFRCLAEPKRFILRYLKALKLFSIFWNYKNNFK